MSQEVQLCPICKGSVDLNVRYPRYLGEDCRLRTVDHRGRFVDFFNVDLAGYGAVALMSPDSKA